jgi:2-hydroxycyclohexanecarboxyl-CoA dehydrogenase
VETEGLFAALLATKGELMGEIARKTVLERQFARPTDVAAAAVYLASDAAEFVTAQVLDIDGGTLIA